MTNKETEDEIEHIFDMLINSESRERVDEVWSEITTDRLLQLNQFLGNLIKYCEREIHYFDSIADAFRDELDRRNKLAEMKVIKAHTCGECWALNYPQVNGSYLCCSPEGERGAIVWPGTDACRMFESRESIDAKAKI